MPAIQIRMRHAFLALAGCLLASAAPALAQAPASGLPMWVIRDADSTIYITGTVNLRPDDVQWRSEKLDAALTEATELWLELAEVGDPEGLNAKLLRTYADKLASTGQPLSSQLTEDERSRLAAAIAEAETPPDIAAKIDSMKGWYAVYAIDRAHDLGVGYRGRNGIDRVLARLARDQGDSIKGLETLEFQVSDMFEMSAEEQLEELRWRLKTDTALQARIKRTSDLAYISWVRGETHMTDALVSLMYLAPNVNNVDWLLRERNESWAATIEKRLAGSGVSFVAVGALHLVGRDSLQKRLKLRGIEAQRY